MINTHKYALLKILGSYDTIKNNVCKRYLGLEEGFTLHFVSSMISGVLTASAANPFDTVKSRYMSDNSNKYASVIDCAIKSYQKDEPYKHPNI